MTLEELAVWLDDEIVHKEQELQRVIDSNRKMPIPDLISRRVIESEMLAYRIVRRKIKEVQ